MQQTTAGNGQELSLIDDCCAEAVLLNPAPASSRTGNVLTTQARLDSFLAEVQDRAYQVARGALWDREMALDVVQESMLRFVEYYRHKPQQDWPALFRTVLNSKVNDQRRKRLLANTKRRLLSLTGLGLSATDRDEALTEAELGTPGHDAGSSAPEAGADADQLKQQIERALGTLAERQRQVFLLREQLGASIRESAEILGCSENSIKQHHFRALRTLRRLLAEVWEHEHA